MQERAGLEALKAAWLVPPDGAAVVAASRSPRWTRRSTSTLVAAAGNPEVARCHREVTERIRIIRRLDFTQAHRIDKTYDEHAQILRAVIRRRADEANPAAALAHRGEQGRGAQDHAAPPVHGARRGVLINPEPHRTADGASAHSGLILGDLVAHPTVQ